MAPMGRTHDLQRLHEFDAGAGRHGAAGRVGPVQVGLPHPRSSSMSASSGTRTSASAPSGEIDRVPSNEYSEGAGGPPTCV